MEYLATLPRRSWLDQIRLVISVAIALVGITALAGLYLRVDFLMQPLPNMAVVRPNEALCILLLGVALVLRELNLKAAAWINVIPACFGIAMMVETILDRDLRFDEVLLRVVGNGNESTHSNPVTAACILLAALTLGWTLFDQSSKLRTYVEAITGSILVSAGFSTIAGYVAALPAVYTWGTEIPMAPPTALAFLLTGSSVLLIAWRDSANEEEGPPAWSPMPAVVGCLTLTIIMWIGLREREFTFLKQTTDTTADSLAPVINSSIETETTAFERMARQFADQPADAKPIWGAEAKAHIVSRQRDKEDAPQSISIVDTDKLTIWVFPNQDYEHIGFDHKTDDNRREAINSAETRLNPQVSGTVELGALKQPGFAIYAPILRSSKVSAYIAADFVYKNLFAAAVEKLKTTNDYYITITVGSQKVYDTTPEVFAGDRALAQDRVYKIFERRVRIGLVPTNESISRGRRYLPELALAAGIGITILLGLSIHFSRRSRSGQRSAELSNKRLVAENEERRRVEARLKVSDERLRLALDSTQIGILEWNVSAGHIYYSPGLWALLGYEHSRMPSTLEAWQSLIHPDDFPAYRRRVESQLNGIATFIDPEYRVRARTGEWRWVYMRAKSVTIGANGRPSRIIGTVQDITARRESEQALRESQAEARKLSLVAAKTDNPVLICSPDGRIEWVNEAFSRIMEYSLEEVVGRDPSVLMAGPDTDPKVVTRFHEDIGRGQSMSVDLVNYSKSGRKYTLHMEMQSVRNESGQLENFIIIENDITARVEMENNLRRAKQEADAASRAKSEFLASMSHEIRTPMNGVIGMTSLLTETTLNSEQRDFVHTIRSSGEALLTIINDILDFSKIESGKMELERMPFELTTCLEEALDLFALQAATKNVEIAYHVEPDVPTWIYGDVTRLRQIVVNLVNNAVKFTPSGAITVVVRRITSGQMRATDPSRVRLEFAVRDTGIGIPPDRIDRLFKAFSQVDSSTTRKYGGTGLGLAICQRLSQLMGGDIRAESTAGVGSAFIFTMLTEPATMPADATPPSPPANLRGRLVLCVDDNLVVQARMKTLFESWGATCVSAPDAESATQVAQALPVPPALVVIDAGESGDQASRNALTNLKCPRLVLLPFGQAAIPPGAGEQPAFPTGTTTKPLKTQAFTLAVALLFNPAAKAAAEAERKESRLLAEEYPLDVLIAEDNPVNQKVAKRFLERLGYQADAVGNGLEAVSTLESRHYDLVLMDLQMPEMDGLEASREIRRKLPAERQPKIVALTANAMQGDRELCLAAGMDDYISKPVKIHEIAAAIRRQFAKRHENAKAEPAPQL